MRRTIATVAALVSAMGGCIAVAGSANAVSDSSTCAAIIDAVEDFSTENDALDSSDPAASAESKRLWNELIATLDDVSANADEGETKATLDNALAQIQRVTTSDDVDMETLAADQAFIDAMNSLDSVCGS